MPRKKKDIVFCLNENPFAYGSDGYGSTGTERVSYDLAHKIQESLGLEGPPQFVPKYWGSPPMPSRNPYFIVGINVPISWQENHFISIGIQDYYSLNLSERKYEILLNPAFNPIELDSDKITPNCKPLVIDYTYTPSRMRPSVVSHHTSQSAPVTVAIYFRPNIDKDDMYDDGAGLYYAKQLVEYATELQRRGNYHFQVSTAPATSQKTAIWLLEQFSKLPNTKFCMFDQTRRPQCSKFLDEAFAEADIICVSHDTISTLSDAMNTGKPVYVLKSLAAPYKPGRGGENNINFKLHNSLFAQGRLQYFTPDNIQAGIKPMFQDDWASICNRIANIIRQKYKMPRLPHVPLSALKR